MDKDPMYTLPPQFSVKVQGDEMVEHRVAKELSHLKGEGLAGSSGRNDGQEDRCGKSYGGQPAWDRIIYSATKYLHVHRSTIPLPSKQD